MKIKQILQFILLLVLSATVIVCKGQIELLDFVPTDDTINIETSKYVSIPDFRYGGSIRIKSQIELIPTVSDSFIIYTWKINETDGYRRDSIISFSDKDYEALNMFQGLSLNIKLSKSGDLIELNNFGALKDSISSRFTQYYEGLDSEAYNEDIDYSSINFDWELYNYYYRSISDAHVFLDIFFPETLIYFNLCNQSFILYESNFETINTTFRRFSLFEIEMSKNSMLVLERNNISEIECQFELTYKGCESISNQIRKRTENMDNLKNNNIESFDCQRSRITQKVIYNKQLGIIESVYQKKSINIDDEPYYFWTEIIKK